jgi:hypothetical protein
LPVCVTVSVLPSFETTTVARTVKVEGPLQRALAPSAPASSREAAEELSVLAPGLASPARS